jgi:hypothetical protein
MLGTSHRTAGAATDSTRNLCRAGKTLEKSVETAIQLELISKKKKKITSTCTYYAIGKRKIIMNQKNNFRI